MSNILISGSQILIATSSDAFSLTSDGEHSVNVGAIAGGWEIDPEDGESVQFRIPKEKFGDDFFKLIGDILYHIIVVQTPEAENESDNRENNTIQSSIQWGLL